MVPRKECCNMQREHGENKKGRGKQVVKKSPTDSRALRHRADLYPALTTEFELSYLAAQPDGSILTVTAECVTAYVNPGRTRITFDVVSFDIKPVQRTTLSVQDGTLDGSSEF